MRRRAAVVVLTVEMLRSTAVAAQAPESRGGAYSRYELETIKLAQERLRTTVDPSPEGKAVEAIDILALDVIEPRDPAPQILNLLFATTRRYVIAREVLLAVDEPFRRVIADETARNLRALPQLSLVIVTPMRGSAPDRVRLVVITKDVWSLRLSWNVGAGPGGLEYLLLQPSETNTLGTHQTVAARYVYYPETHTFGGSYTWPRVAGSRVALRGEGAVVVNRRSGAAEGSNGSILVQQPLWSTRTAWAWSVSASWRNEVTRRYVNARPALFKKSVPFQWRTDNADALGQVTRSYGWALKNDVTFGFGAQRRAFRTGDLTAADPVEVAEFRGTRVPVSDTRVGPYAQWHGYTTSFMRILDAETLGLQEDYRLGHEAYARLYPVARALGSSRDFLGAYLSGQYTVPLADGYARGAVEWIAEREPNRLTDASLSAALRIVSPRLALGRLVLDIAGIHRYRNYLRARSFLGGDTRLRGYPSNFFDGKDLISYNLELRSRPLEIFSFQIGAALFWDAGDAFDGGQRRVHNAAGAGLRALFPQLDRTAFRFDVAFPVAPQGRPAGVAPMSFFVAFDQAFPVPRIAP